MIGEDAFKKMKSIAVLINVILCPHAAWYSEQAMAGLQACAPGDVRRVLTGEWPVNVVNGAVKGKSRAGM
jgi:D-3-phosphoglycerate dehydrogenase